MFKSLCTSYFHFHGGIFCGPRRAWGLFVWDPPLDIPLLSFPEDPRLGFRFVLLFGRAVPSALGNPWVLSPCPQIPISDAFELLLGGATTAGLLLGCLPRAGSYSSLEHWLQKLLFLILTKQTNGKNLYIVLVFYLFLLLFLSTPGGGFL